METQRKNRNELTRKTVEREKMQKELEEQQKQLQLTNNKIIINTNSMENKRLIGKGKGKRHYNGGALTTGSNFSLEPLRDNVKQIIIQISKMVEYYEYIKNNYNYNESTLSVVDDMKKK